MATTANAAKKLVDCACSAFEFGLISGDETENDSYTTGCNAKTHSIFAQGHDAKLVGYLVRAELNGDEISYTSGGLRISPAGAVLAAAKISDALAAKAQAQLDAAHARLAKKAAARAAAAARKSAKAATAIAPAPPVRKATIKKGRWTYEAQIDEATGWATFINRKGENVSIARTDYTEV